MMLTMFDGIKANSTNFNWELRERKRQYIMYKWNISSLLTDNAMCTLCARGGTMRALTERKGEGVRSIYKIAKNFSILFVMHLMEFACVCVRSRSFLRQ